MRIRDVSDLERLDFSKGEGLLPVVAQHGHTGEVLTLAYANRLALEKALSTGEMHFWSRSRSALWRKGESSGNVQRVIALFADCDRDAVVAHVLPAGPACHTGAKTCFSAPPVLAGLGGRIGARLRELPEESYTTRLAKDRNLRLKKLGEEASELVLACADRDRERIAEEAADLLYHVLVAAQVEGVEAEAILEVLAQRFK